jgi:hypothetical protein
MTWLSVQLHVPVTGQQRKELPEFLSNTPDGSHNRSRRFGKRAHLLPTAGNITTILTSSRLKLRLYTDATTPAYFLDCNMLYIKKQLLASHTFLQTEIWVTNTPSVKMLCPQINCLSLHFLSCWSI